MNLDGLNLRKLAIFFFNKFLLLHEINILSACFERACLWFAYFELMKEYGKKTEPGKYKYAFFSIVKEEPNINGSLEN